MAGEQMAYAAVAANFPRGGIGAKRATMTTPDAFAAYHADWIDAAYDCVDRLDVNCYFQRGQSGGSFRTFWHARKGDDAHLCMAGLRQAAGDLARRLKAHCERHAFPWIECGAGDVKYEIARDLRPTDPKFRGLFAVLVGRAPAPVWDVRRNDRDQISGLHHPGGLGTAHVCGDLWLTGAKLSQEGGAYRNSV